MVAKSYFCRYNDIKVGKMHMTIRSRVHVVLLRVSEFHP